MTRWIDLLLAIALVERHSDPDREGGVLLTLSDLGAAAVRRQLEEEWMALSG